MNALCSIAKRRGLLLIEDAAQAIGARYRERQVGRFGEAAAFSCHPLKNLAAAGDAGFIVFRDGDVATRARRMRNHGLLNRDECTEWGVNARMDVLQAVLLHHRLGGLDATIAKRRRNADLYRENILSPAVRLPRPESHEHAVYHCFVIQAERRDELSRFLAGRNIRTLIHYPVPIHLQPAAHDLGYGPGSLPATERQAKFVLSLPIHPYLSEDQVRYVGESVDAFYRR